MRDAYGRIIEIASTKEEVETIMVDNILLHSKFYPKNEAKTFIEKNKDKYFNEKLIVVYGIALGYHLEVLLGNIDEFTIVKIFDLDAELYNITKDTKTISKISNDKRVELFVGDTTEFFNEFSKALKDVKDILIYKPAVKVLPRKYEEFKDTLERFDIGKANVEKYADLMVENDINNAKINCENIDSFLLSMKVVSKPVVIVSAGPSLDQVIDYLKLSRDEITIFAAGSALRPLVEKNIKPDMFCIIDPNEIICKQIDECEELEIPLCFLNTASNKAIEKYKGPRYKFYNEPYRDNIIVETGKSVATAVISIALILKCNPIIFVGQDLAFINSKSHCLNYPNDTLENGYINNRKVIGVNGAQLDTTPVFLYFKKWIENKISENKKTCFINCSSGARIEGTIEMSIKDAIKYKVQY